jgi:sugar phosphate permease
MIRLGVAIFALGFIGLSQIDSLAGFYACAVMLAIGASLGGCSPLTEALIQWFERHRARSMLSVGLALGGLLVPVVAWAMYHFGWRHTAMGSGVIALVLGLLLASVIRRRPQDHGETVDGLPPAAADTADAAASARPAHIEFTASQALRTRAFWLLALGHALALLVVTAVNVHAITHLKEGLGYTVPQAALAIMLLTFATHVFEVAAFALLHGVAWGLRGPFMQAIRADYFGRNAIGIILGLSAVVTALGQIGGPMVAGMLADLTGNYRWGFSVPALAAGGGVPQYRASLDGQGDGGANLLESATLAAAIETLTRAAPSAEQIVVFGSHARAQANPDSDLDLLVIEPTVENRVSTRASGCVGLFPR